MASKERDPSEIQAELGKILGKYPGIAPATEGMHAALEAAMPVLEMRQQFEDKLLGALANCSATRAEFLTAVKEGHGDPQLAQRLNTELLLLELRAAMGLDPTKGDHNDSKGADRSVAQAHMQPL